MLATPDTSEVDDGLRSLRSAPARTCAVSREVRPVDDLIRFVTTPDNGVVADVKRKLPGFKRDVVVSPTLADDVDALLVRSLIEALAIAAKAGEIVAGFTKVEQALTTGRARGLIHAREASPDGIRKLAGIARQNGFFDQNGGEPPVIDVLSSDELDLALGRSNVIHAAVLAGAASTSFLLRSQTLARYRAAAGGHATGKTGRPGPERETS